MKSRQFPFSFLGSAVVLVAGVWVLYPFLQYYVDPDATAYLTLVQRYAEGDLERAINGYWSPWAVWLTAILWKVKFFSLFGSAIVVNTVGAVGFLWAGHLLFKRFSLQVYICWVLEMTMACFLIYAVYWQSFDDLWACAFLLVAFLLMTKSDFFQKRRAWILVGLLGALAYLSKAYALPFFLLEVVVLIFWLPVVKRKQKMVASAIILLAFLACGSPWFFLLHEKYGIWTTGTAGELNRSWYLVGRPVWQEGITALLPPVYPDSPSYWEDPFIVNGSTPQFWSSISLFALQCVRLGYNVMKFVQSTYELSPFFLPVYLGSALTVLLRKENRHREKAALLSFLLFPAGYFLVNFQGRYLWYMIPFSMVLGIFCWRQICIFSRDARRYTGLFLAVFALSFLISPVWGIKDMWREGQNEFIQAEKLKELGIHGSFTSNLAYGQGTQELQRLAWFWGHPYYYLPLSTDKDALLNDMRRWGVQYYLHIHPPGWNEFQLIDEWGRPLPEVTENKVPGLKLFLVTSDTLRLGK